MHYNFQNKKLTNINAYFSPKNKQVTDLQEVDLFHAVKPSFGIIHLKDLDFLQGHYSVIHFAPSPIHYTELPLANLLLNLVVTQCTCKTNENIKAIL